MKEKLTSYRGGFLGSLCVHGLLVIFLGMSFNSKIPQRQLPKNKVDMIQAVVVDEKAVSIEMNRLVEEKNLQKAEEQRRVADLKNQLLKTKKEAEDKLAHIKLAREKEAKQLEVLKQEKEKEKKQLAAIEAQRKKEEAHAKQAQQAKLKEAQAKKLAQEQVQDEDSERSEHQTTPSTDHDANWIHSEMEKYDALMKQKINQSWTRPPGLPGGLQCELYARLLPDGSVVSPSVKVSSGNTAFDQAAIAALQKASPLPVPQNASLMDEFRQFNFKFSPPEEI